MTCMRIFLAILSVAVLATPARAAQATPSCEEWNTKEYFQTATVENVTACLDAGADPMARDYDGDTPLNKAAGYNENPAVVQVLLAAGAELEVRDKDGNTPLHWAAKYVHFHFPDYVKHLGDDDPHAGGAIEALLDAGADPMARNAAGETPWDLAKANKALKGSDAYWRLNDARFEGETR